jgi:hypothetical protein
MSILSPPGNRQRDVDGWEADCLHRGALPLIHLRTCRRDKIYRHSGQGRNLSRSFLGRFGTLRWEAGWQEARQGWGLSQKKTPSPLSRLEKKSCEMGWQKAYLDSGLSLKKTPRLPSCLGPYW